MGDSGSCRLYIYNDRRNPCLLHRLKASTFALLLDFECVIHIMMCTVEKDGFSD